MSTNLIVGLIVAAVVVVGGGYLLMSSGSLSMAPAVADLDRDGVEDVALTGDAKTPRDVSTGQSSGKATPKLAESAASFTGSWNDLVKRGGNYACEINHQSANDSTTGMVYVSGTDVRGTFYSNTSTGAVTSNMLKKGDTVYVWTNAYPTGFVMKATAMGGSAQTDTSGQGVDANQSYNWNCSAIGADASQFAIPTGIEFMDLSEMMQGGGVPSY